MDDARRIDLSILPTATPGQSLSVRVTLLNAGSTTWLPGSYQLAITGDYLPWGEPTRVALPAAVSPGQQVVLDFTVTMPSVFTFAWQMTQYDPASGLLWFGDRITRPIRVAVNAASADSSMLALYNAERSRRGIPLLQLHPALMASAETFAVRLAAAGRLDHFLDGTTPWGRTQTAGYSSSSVGENIAEGQRDAAEAVADWMADAPHAANVLNPAWRDAGFGTADAGGVRYWVADLGTTAVGAGVHAPGGVRKAASP